MAEKEIYRFHAIFGEFLKSRFDTLNSDEKYITINIAANIFEKLGDYSESICHYLSIKKYNDAIRLIKAKEFDYQTWSFIGEIPLEALSEDKEMAIQRLFYHYCYDGIDRLTEFFDAFKECMEKDENWKVLKIAKVILMDMDFQTDVMSIDDIEQMNISNVTKTILYIKTSSFLYMKYRFNEALLFMEKTAQCERKLKNHTIRLYMFTLKSAIKEEMGDLGECEKLYQEIFNIFNTHKIYSHMKSNLLIGLAGVYLKKGNLTDAENTLEEAGLNYKLKNILTDGGYLYNLMELRLLQGRVEESYEIAQKLIDLDTYSNLIFSSSLVRYLIFMDKMNEELKDKYLAEYSKCRPEYLRIEDKLSFARLMAFDKNFDKALGIIDELLILLRANKIKVKLIEALLLKANILNKDIQKNDKCQILNLFREAVYYSHENCIVSFFMFERKISSQYLPMLMGEKSKDMRSEEISFIQHIIKLLGIQMEPQKHDSVLSDREIEVLRELAKGLSNKEIGESLCISVATVKSHIINIYSKLQIGNRVEAVEIGRKLELI